MGEFNSAADALFHHTARANNPIPVKVSAAERAIEHRAAAADLLQRAEGCERVAKEEAAKAAVLKRVEDELALAAATGVLLCALRGLTGGQGGFLPQDDLAKFRQQLQPLALTYGYKIVLVGDKTKAMLVAV